MFEDPSEVQHILSPRDRWTIQANNIDLRRHVESMYDKLQGIMRRSSIPGRVFL